MRGFMWRHSPKDRYWLIPAFLFVFSLVPSAVMASGGGEGGEGPDLVRFGWQVFDFLTLAVLLWWLLAGKVKSFFGGRQEEIKTALEEARLAKEEAQRKFEEYSSKLEKATGEIEGLYEMIKSQGLVEKEKILEDAKKAAEKMKEDTQTRIEQEFKKASSQLRLEAVQLSVQMAEDILNRNVTPEDHKNMVKDYLDKVVRKH